MSERIYWNRTSNGIELGVEVTVVSQDRYDPGNFVFDGSIDEVVASLNAIREMIPEKYQSSARCEIDSVSSYEDSHYASITVRYRRPATQEETEHWHAQKAAETTAKEERERATLAALQAKYGAGSNPPRP